MFDALLDDFEDDVTRATDEEEAFQKLPLEEIDETLDEGDLEVELEEGEGETPEAQAKPAEEEDKSAESVVAAS